METHELLKENTIVYALIATTWLLFSDSLHVPTVPWTFITLALYLFIDVLQYLSKVIIAHIAYRREFKGTTLKFLKEISQWIDCISYWLFYTKVLVLLTAIILLGISIYNYRDMLLLKF